MPAVSGGIHDLVHRKAGLILQAELENPLMALAGESDEHAIKMHYKTSANRGSTERVMFARPNWSTIPKAYGEPVVGQEDEGTVEYDEVRIDKFVLDGKVPDTNFDQQIVTWDVGDKERDRLGAQWAYWWQKWFCAQATGQTTLTASDPGNRSHFPLSGGNDIVAHDADHVVIAKKSDDTIPANENSLDSTCILTTETLTRAISQGTSRATVENPIAPCITPWGKKYVVGVGTQGLVQLRSDDPRNRFTSIAEATLSGGAEYLESALANWTGYIFEDMLILKVPALDDPDHKFRGINGTSTVANTGVGFFLGANALQLVIGEGLDEDWLHYSEFLIHDYLSIKTHTVCGVKRTRPSTWNESWAAMRLVHYSSVA